MIKINGDISPIFADEQAGSIRVYPKGYAEKKIEEQVETFPELDGSEAVGIASRFSDRPIRLFAIPKPEKIRASSLAEANQLALARLRALPMFQDLLAYDDLELSYLKQEERTMGALELLSRRQRGDFWVVGGQLGLQRRGESPRHTRMNYDANEFGSTLYLGAMVVLANPERLAGEPNELWMNNPGDQYWQGEGVASKVSAFSFYAARLRLRGNRANDRCPSYGSVTFFILPEI